MTETFTWKYAKCRKCSRLAWSRGNVWACQSLCDSAVPSGRIYMTNDVSVHRGRAFENHYISCLGVTSG